MRSIHLYNPRHNSAPSEGLGQIYLPSSLAVVGARILAAGGEITFQDGNIDSTDIDHDLVGVHVLGAPYIPEIIKLRNQILGVVGLDKKIILGGQVISGLSRSQFQHIFGENCANGNADHSSYPSDPEYVLKNALGLQLRHLPEREMTSLVPFYDKLSDADFVNYFSHEWCLYLSQGCKYACTFCAAERTKIDPISGNIMSVKEQYRDMEVLAKELEYLAERAMRLNIATFNVYLSNLDLFQTPIKLKEFARVLIEVRKRYPIIRWNLRGLSTAHEFMRTYKHDRQTIELMIEAGLWSIGFGVDGTSKAVWRSIKKTQNQLPECIEAIRLTRAEFGITPEMFMVVGHATDTRDSLYDDLEFTLDMQEQFGALPRPYVAKNIVPGNSGWTDTANAHIVDSLLQNPSQFADLDYACLPTPLTHPDQQLRQMICDTFIKMTQISGSTTNIVYPTADKDDSRSNRIHGRLNKGKWDR